MDDPRVGQVWEITMGSGPRGVSSGDVVFLLVERCEPRDGSSDGSSFEMVALFDELPSGPAVFRLGSRFVLYERVLRRDGRLVSP